MNNFEKYKVEVLNHSPYIVVIEKFVNEINNNKNTYKDAWLGYTYETLKIKPYLFEDGNINYINLCLIKNDVAKDVAKISFQKDGCIITTKYLNNFRDEQDLHAFSDTVLTQNLIKVLRAYKNKERLYS